jgi:preprotein translocase subunit SecE
VSAEQDESALEPTRRSGTRRPGPVARTRTYYREIVAELRKVIYPTRSELVTYTVVVLVFVTFMVALVAGFDYAFTRLDLRVFG